MESGSETMTDWTADDEKAYLVDHMKEVSRSCALVAPQVEPPLNEKPAIAYLVCRVIDNSEMDRGIIRTQDPAEEDSIIHQHCALLPRLVSGYDQYCVKVSAKDNSAESGDWSEMAAGNSLCSFHAFRRTNLVGTGGSRHCPGRIGRCRELSNHTAGAAVGYRRMGLQMMVPTYQALLLAARSRTGYSPANTRRS